MQLMHPALRLSFRKTRRSSRQSVGRKPLVHKPSVQTEKHSASSSRRFESSHIGTGDFCTIGKPMQSNWLLSGIREVPCIRRLMKSECRQSCRMRMNFCREFMYFRILPSGTTEKRFPVTNFFHRMHFHCAQPLCGQSFPASSPVPAKPGKLRRPRFVFPGPVKGHSLQQSACAHLRN